MVPFDNDVEVPRDQNFSWRSERGAYLSQIYRQKINKKHRKMCEAYRAQREAEKAEQEKARRGGSLSNPMEIDDSGLCLA